MCGIVAVWDPRLTETMVEAVVRPMTEALRHRGPDAGDVWWDAAAGIALGHRRLSIIDLSAEGRQPMWSSTHRFCIAYNGEIFNFQDLRCTLEQAGHLFRGHSDTEVLLAAFEHWGVPAAVDKCVGMFACVVWDAVERRLVLVRDRLGIKPLYYGWCGRSFVVSSELGVLRYHPEFSGTLEPQALAQYFRYNYVPAPASIYAGITKLAPGSIFTVSAQQLRDRVPWSADPDDATAALRPQRYWSAIDVACRGVASPWCGTTDDLLEQLDTMLSEAVRLRLRSDVPLGAFLSGGIDSSLVVALMQRQSARPVKTFTIGFLESDYDEAPQARAVSHYLGTEHTELYVTQAHAMDAITRLPGLYDEPFSDASQIPTFLIAQLARQYVTVSLSGDGGDELFGGYHRHIQGGKSWRWLSHTPALVRRWFAEGARRISPAQWQTIFHCLQSVVPMRWRLSQPSEKIYKFAAACTAATHYQYYERLVARWHDGAPMRSKDAVVFSPVAGNAAQALGEAALAERMMLWDLITYLPDDVLTKLDRATMAVGLEGRVPLLDHRIVEFAWRIPIDMKVRGGRGKWILRQLLARYIPPHVTERPKMGFSVPIATWVRGPLRDWVEHLLERKQLEASGLLDATLICQRWNEHVTRRRDWQQDLWPVLMFQGWRAYQASA
ncbi:MAG: asparagine synthase (glutamine-hydrolyzing) [Deltaproteobacteria bacterium]|nr:asparagine synthase (glutamine-hydrolyzing) [Deltaproteobacteria bacterium]